MKKIIVAGGRDFYNYELVKESLKAWVTNNAAQHTIIIISGAARGADRLGEQAGKELGYFIKQFPAQWEKYGRSAGYKRNDEMAKHADVLLAFWDGESRGTKHMIDTANRKGLEVNIVNY